MEKSGMPTDSGPIGVMLYEHNVGRKYIAQAEVNLKQFKEGGVSARSIVKDNSLNYCDSLTHHIQKEDTILYPMAERMIVGNVLQEMTKQFEKLNFEHNTEVIEKY